MPKTYRSWVSMLALASTLAGHAGRADAQDQRGAANPDPKNIAVVAAKQTVTVQPRNDPEDFRNLQWVFDNAVAGGTVELGAGTFFLGDGKAAPRQTVVVRRGVRVTGIKKGDEWQTVVRGGGAILTPGVGGAIESGPFRIVAADDPHPMSFENVWFREWSCEVVFIQGVNGFSFRNSRISHPANRANPGVKYVHAIYTSGSKTRGDFTVDNNLVELRNYDGASSDDEQLLGVFFSNHDTVRVTNNVITGLDEAIEIIGNRKPTDGPGATGPGQIIVTGNRIDITSNPGANWPSSWAILVGGNANVDAVQIKDNQIVTRGKGLVFGISGAKLAVTGNRVRLEEHNGAYPPGVVSIGFGGGRIANMDASLVDSVFTDNVFEGKVSGPGIEFRPGNEKDPNKSHDNRFDLGASLAKLGAKPTLAVSKDVHGNRFAGDLGVVEDASPKGANEFSVANGNK